MTRFNNPLAGVHVASPCQADWNQMMGDDRVRFCGACSLNVFNLSAMSRAEAESLIARTEGRLCVKFYRRRDGSILTEDCPVGLRAIRRRMSYLARAIASAVLSFMAGVGIHEAFSSSLAPLLPRRTMGLMGQPISRADEVADPHNLVKSDPLIGTYAKIDSNRKAKRTHSRQ
jgi:hypothetical protein